MTRKKTIPATKTAPEKPPNRGKEPVVINAPTLKKVAALGCTIEEAAEFFECSEKTLDRKLKSDPELRQAWKEGQARIKMSLRRLQWRHANGEGSAAVHMTIHLSKHLLGQTDKAALDIGNKDGKPFAVIINGRDADA